jgi:16S rRNA (cytidine1402-2'-O)-methyltransferase
MALVQSGLATGRFVFEGFIPRKGAARSERLADVARERRTVVLFEAPHRLERTLTDLFELCVADRRITLARELTKMHEQIWRGTLAEALDHIRAVEPRGEYVLVLEGAAGPASASDSELRDAIDAARARGVTTRDAVEEVSTAFGAAKRRVYDLAIGPPEAAPED